MIQKTAPEPPVVSVNDIENIRELLEMLMSDHTPGKAPDQDEDQLRVGAARWMSSTRKPNSS